jgi:hypothetical protein
MEFGGTSTVVGNDFGNGAWKYVAGVAPSSGNDRIYIDGYEVATYNNQVDTVFVEGIWALQIGYQHPQTGDFMHLDGMVGEVRISDTERSDAWLTATYHTLRDTFLTFNDAITFASIASIDTNITDPVFDIEEMPFDWDGFEGDDYDGDDYALPNSEVWEIMGTDSGSPPDYGVFTLNNRMRCDLIGSPTSTLYGVQSRFELQARDFDVHVDFYRISTTVETGTLGITFSSGYSYRLSVTNTFTNGYVSQHWNPGYGQSTYAAGCPAIGAFGGLRMKKSGATLTSYYWTGGSWNQAKVWTVAQQTATVLNFVAHVAKVTEVEFDNFEITNGVINPPA